MRFCPRVRLRAHKVMRGGPGLGMLQAILEFGQCHIPAAPQLLHREECYLEATHTLLAQVWERFIRP